MKTILVTGGKGQLGKCINELTQKMGFKMLFADINELDITNTKSTNEFFINNDIDWCINCAAYTAVDKAESDLDKAQLVNVFGSKNLAEACKKQSVKLIHISTDFVFDGTKHIAYTEEDNANPVSVYGKTKHQGELEIQSILKENFIIRTSWLYSEYANNFMKTMLRLGKDRNSLNIVGDQIGTPTYAKDLAAVIIQIIESDSNDYGLYHYSNEGVASWYDFANAIFELANKQVKTSPIPTTQYPTPAKRPYFSVLNKTKIKETFNLSIPHWRLSLKNAITNLQMNNEIETAIQASIAAGKVIMEVYDSPFNVEIKDDKSPLTEADKRANEIINSFLKPTEIPIISEENKQVDFEVRKNWNTCWIVDPVDGTKEFIKRNGEFTVNIALVEEGKPKFGVIYVPATKELYVGDVIKKYAYKVQLKSHDETIDELLDKKQSLTPKLNNSNLVQVVGSRSHMNQETLDYVESVKEQGKDVEIVSKGSSLKFCLVAEGKADVYPRFAPTMEWDTAAGQAICNAVGINVISKETNAPLLYNKENLLNPWFLVSK